MQCVGVDGCVIWDFHTSFSILLYVGVIKETNYFRLRMYISENILLGKRGTIQKERDDTEEGRYRRRETV